MRAPVPVLSAGSSGSGQPAPAAAAAPSPPVPAANAAARLMRSITAPSHTVQLDMRSSIPVSRVLPNPPPPSPPPALLHRQISQHGPMPSPMRSGPSLIPRGALAAAAAANAPGPTTTAARSSATTTSVEPSARIPPSQGGPHIPHGRPTVQHNSLAPYDPLSRATGGVGRQPVPPQSHVPAHASSGPRPSPPQPRPPPQPLSLQISPVALQPHQQPLRNPSQLGHRASMELPPTSATSPYQQQQHVIPEVGSNVIQLPPLTRLSLPGAPGTPSRYQRPLEVNCSSADGTAGAMPVTPQALSSSSFRRLNSSQRGSLFSLAYAASVAQAQPPGTAGAPGPPVLVSVSPGPLLQQQYSPGALAQESSGGSSIDVPLLIRLNTASSQPRQLPPLASPTRAMPALSLPHPVVARHDGPPSPAAGSTPRWPGYPAALPDTPSESRASQAAAAASATGARDSPGSAASSSFYIDLSAPEDSSMSWNLEQGTRQVQQQEQQHQRQMPMQHMQQQEQQHQRQMQMQHVQQQAQLQQMQAQIQQMQQPQQVRRMSALSRAASRPTTGLIPAAPAAAAAGNPSGPESIGTGLDDGRAYAGRQASPELPSSSSSSAPSMAMLQQQLLLREQQPLPFPGMAGVPPLSQQQQQQQRPVSTVSSTSSCGVSLAGIGSANPSSPSAVAGPRPWALSAAAGDRRGMSLTTEAVAMATATPGLDEGALQVIGMGSSSPFANHLHSQQQQVYQPQQQGQGQQHAYVGGEQQRPSAYSASLRVARPSISAASSTSSSSHYGSGVEATYSLQQQQQQQQQGLQQQGLHEGYEDPRGGPSVDFATFMLDSANMYTFLHPGMMGPVRESEEDEGEEEEQEEEEAEEDEEEEEEEEEGEHLGALVSPGRNYSRPSTLQEYVRLYGQAAYAPRLSDESGGYGGEGACANGGQAGTEESLERDEEEEAGSSARSSGRPRGGAGVRGADQGGGQDGSHSAVPRYLPYPPGWYPPAWGPDTEVYDEDGGASDVSSSYYLAATQGMPYTDDGGYEPQTPQQYYPYSEEDDDREGHVSGGDGESMGCGGVRGGGAGHGRATADSQGSYDGGSDYMPSHLGTPSLVQSRIPPYQPHLHQQLLQQQLAQQQQQQQQYGGMVPGPQAMHLPQQYGGTMPGPQGMYMPQLHPMVGGPAGTPPDGSVPGTVSAGGWSSSLPYGMQMHPSHLAQWTHHAARLLLPHSMRDLADLLMGDGWRPGLADALPSFNPPGASPGGPTAASAATAGMPAGSPIVPLGALAGATLHWPPNMTPTGQQRQLHLNDVEGHGRQPGGPLGDATAGGLQMQGGRMMPMPPPGLVPPAGHARFFSKLNGRTLEDSVAVGSSATAKDVPSSEVLGGRHPSPHIRAMLVDPEAVARLLATLRGVNPQAACVRATVSALAGQGVPAALLASVEPPVW